MLFDAVCAIDPGQDLAQIGDAQTGAGPNEPKENHKNRAEQLETFFEILNQITCTFSKQCIMQVAFMRLFP